MLYIHATNKILKFLKIVKDEANLKPNNNDLFVWHANMVDVFGENFLILMNALTKFTVIIFGLREEHLNQMDIFIKDAIVTTMLESGIPRNDVIKYLALIKNISFGKSKDRISISRLNGHSNNIWLVLEEFFDYNHMLQNKLCHFVNDMYVVGINTKHYMKPRDKMAEYLNLMFN